MAVSVTIMSVKITQMTTIVWQYFVWLYSYVAQGTFLDTRGRHFWMTTALLCLLLGLPCTWNGSVPAAHSRGPTFFIHQFFEPVAYAEFSCGSKWNQNCAHQVNCAQAEDPGVYLGKKYLNNLLEKQVSESSDVYIYMNQNKLCYPTNGTCWVVWLDGHIEI